MVIYAFNKRLMDYFMKGEICINSSARWYIFVRHMPGDRGRSDE
ncbi:hypothetical protein ECDEC15B_3277 [Escherichia coli DEC15B]|nr:hypothetical protein ECDEC15A_3592 [Escherichia coli DEC15A]EHY04021.1 hypothetical protein ECDEC15B_3277 [Escherichia coli DEC15B]EHY05552.1 hypothetical protein ECDEC15C_3304 [Escherichia coli DEC15C]KEK83906.1 hypothetical protein AB48_1332 [Escherichia coli 3-475-03_S1_C2]